MRMRSRLLWSFLSAHIVLTVFVGILSNRLLHDFLTAQAENSAQAVARVLSAGGFSLTPTVQQRMQELTAYQFEVVAPEHIGQPVPVGMIQVESGSVVVRIDYRTPAYDAALDAVFWATAIVALVGVIIFGVIAWVLSRRVALPLEHLAAATRRLGSGSWEQPIPVVGGGEVASLATDLDSMRCQLIDLDQRNRQAERLATLGTFTAAIAHEVRNPLSAIRLAIQLLRPRVGNDPSLAMVEEEIERLDDTVDELLGYATGMAVQVQPYQLANIAENVARLLRRQGEHAGVNIVVSGTACCLVDPRRIKQLLLNLVLNGIQAQHHSGGQVRIIIHDQGLSVEDDGPGVPAARRAKLFEAFHSDKAHGTGLGLHLSRLICQAHGAELSYHDLQPQGSRFTVSGLKPVEPADDTGAEAQGEQD